MPQNQAAASSLATLSDVPGTELRRLDATFESFSEFVDRYSPWLSDSTIFVETAEAIPVGAPVCLEIKLSQRSALIRALGQIEWARETADEEAGPPGVAINISYLDPASARLIDSIFRLYTGQESANLGEKIEETWEHDVESLIDLAFAENLNQQAAEGQAAGKTASGGTAAGKTASGGTAAGKTAAGGTAAEATAPQQAALSPAAEPGQVAAPEQAAAQEQTTTREQTVGPLQTVPQDQTIQIETEKLLAPEPPVEPSRPIESSATPEPPPAVAPAPVAPVTASEAAEAQWEANLSAAFSEAEALDEKPQATSFGFGLAEETPDPAASGLGTTQDAASSEVLPPVSFATPDSQTSDAAPRGAQGALPLSPVATQPIKIPSELSPPAVGPAATGPAVTDPAATDSSWSASSQASFADVEPPRDGTDSAPGSAPAPGTAPRSFLAEQPTSDVALPPEPTPAEPAMAAPVETAPSEPVVPPSPNVAAARPSDPAVASSDESFLRRSILLFLLALVVGTVVYFLFLRPDNREVPIVDVAPTEVPMLADPTAETAAPPGTETPGAGETPAAVEPSGIEAPSAGAPQETAPQETTTQQTAPQETTPLQTQQTAPPTAAQPANEGTPAPIETPAADPATATAEVESLIEAWAAAWSKQDPEAFIACYAPDYSPPGLTHEQWRQQRRARIRAPASIRVQAKNLEIEMVDANNAKVVLYQDYETDTKRLFTWKTMDVSRLADGWRITSVRSGR